MRATMTLACLMLLCSCAPVHRQGPIVRWEWEHGLWHPVREDMIVVGTVKGEP